MMMGGILVISQGVALASPAIENCRIMGYDILAGTTDPKSWESLGEFNPHRFLQEGSPIDYMGHDYDLMPFGTGRRRCPGINFGVVVIELALANSLKRFDLDLSSGMKVEDIDFEEEYGFSTHKKNPLSLVPIRVTK